MKPFLSSNVSSSFKSLIAAVLFFSTPLFAQHESSSQKNFKQSVSAGIGHTMVAKGVEDGSKKWLSLPSWAIDYAYRINPDWTIGLQNEIIVTDFEVETFDNQKVVNRTKPFSSVAILGYYPWQGVMVFLGGGGEFALEESFAMMRVGAEPSIEINELFELVLAFTYDFKIEGYDSFGLRLGVGYKF